MADAASLLPGMSCRFGWGVGALRRRGLLLLLIAGQVLLAGCSGAPASSDRKPTEASPTPSAGASAPMVGSCYDGNAIERYRSEMRAIAKVDTCDVKHVAETAYIGTLNGSAPPTGADLRAIWAECEKGASDYLGDDWHGARADLVMFTPTPEEWSGGERGFRCDLAETTDDFGLVARRTASLKDGLRGARPLAITCLKLVADDTAPVPCTESHRYEYAGYAVAADGPYPADDAAFRKAFDGGCETIVAKYTNMTVSQLRAHRQLQSIWYRPDERHWDLGDRSARCYVGLPAVPDVRRSVRGIGNHTL